MIWSANLAYVVGLITTDGSLSKDKRHINLTSKDIEQINNFKNILNLKNKIGEKVGSYGGSNTCYYIQFGNVKFYRFLIGIGLMANKTKKLHRLDIPDNYFSDFLRGHLDGDGYTNSYWDKRWKSSFMLYTGFVSASKRHLEWLQSKILDLFDISGKINFNGKSTYHLVYAKKASVKLISKMYYSDKVICLSRKRFKIETALGIIHKQAEVLKLVYRHA